ncbi:MAG: arginase [Planctomycetes bacterium]|nr:arginase [Planctomycetota bacterium]
MKIRIIGVPVDLGAGRRGVDMGPSAIRYAQLQEKLRSLGHEVDDAGDMEVAIPETQAVRDSKLRYLPEIVAFSRVCADAVEKALREGCFPLVLGGDHSIAVGTLWGVTRVKRDCGVLWFDAHGDFNTAETTPSGNIHGMSFASSLGMGAPELTQNPLPASRLSPRRCVLIGARSLDPGEQRLLRASGVHVYTMHEVDKYGMKDVVGRALDEMRGADGVHLSFDMDVVDPREAPGVGTPVRGGITFREAHLAMELVAEARVVTSMEMAEVNPILDHQNQTAELAAHLMASALGMRIMA